MKHTTTLKGRVGRQHHDVSGKASEDENLNVDWPSEAHYMPILPNACMLSLTAQPLPMMKTLKAAIRVVSGDVIFDSAYPAVDSVACSTYCCDVLSGCATKLGFKKLAARFRDDGELLKVSVAIVRSYTSACGAVVDVGIILAQHPNLKHSHRLQRCCKHQN